MVSLVICEGRTRERASNAMTRPKAIRKAAKDAPLTGRASQSVKRDHAVVGATGAGGASAPFVRPPPGVGLGKVGIPDFFWFFISIHRGRQAIPADARSALMTEAGSRRIQPKDEVRRGASGGVSRREGRGVAVIPQCGNGGARRGGRELCATRSDGCSTSRNDAAADE
jgi:hypothetical protein